MKELSAPLFMKTAANAWEKVVKDLVVRGDTAKARDLMKTITMSLPRQGMHANRYIRAAQGPHTSALKEFFYNPKYKDVSPMVYASALKGAQKEWRDHAAVYNTPDSLAWLKNKLLDLRRTAREEGLTLPRRTNNPEDVVDIMHGGGKRFLGDLLLGKTKGYGLEHRIETGIQVHPYKLVDGISDGYHELFNRSMHYAEKSKQYFDNPAILTGKIKAKYLLGNSAVGFEGGVPAKHIDKLINPIIHDLPTTLVDLSGWGTKPNMEVYINSMAKKPIS